MAKREKTGTEGIHKALTHPMRGEILLRMQESGPLSPMMYSTATARSLNLVAYHFKTLAQHGAIELVDTKPRRGATEHFYAINPDSPVVRLLFASRVSEARSQDPSEEFLRRVIETDSDDKTGVSITPVLVDNAGRKEVQDILADTSKRLRKAEAASHDRTKSSDKKPTPLHVAMAAFRWDRQGD